MKKLFLNQSTSQLAAGMNGSQKNLPEGILRSLLRSSSLFFALLILLFPKSISAQEKINSFDATITAGKDGSMNIEESIDYDFGSQFRHGIFRNIPLVSKVGNLYRVIEIDFQKILRENKSEKFQIDNSSNKTQVKIGDPDKTITGVNNYIINYTVKNGIGSNYETHDEIYWNVTGDGWEVPIEKASVILKTDFGVLPRDTICFTGISGSKESECKIEKTPDGVKVSTDSPLDAFEGLTLVTSFPVNTFPKSTLQKNEPFADPDFLNFLKIYAFVWAVLNLIVAPYLYYWYLKNKSKIRFGPPAVNFDIPKAGSKTIMPSEAGIIDSFKLERDDIVAAIFDLAIRKYIKIEEVKIAKTLRPDETDYKLVKLKGQEGLNKFEEELYSRLFENGDNVKLADLKTDFYVTFGLLEKEIFRDLVEKKLYSKNPKDQMAVLLILGGILFVLGNIILGPVLIFLSRKLNGRTQAGDKVDWEVDGLKIFLKAVSRYHKFQSKNLITVEKYIPFAIALGLQREFMEQLKIINPDYNPSWYSGGRGFYNSYPLMYSSFGSNVTTSAPSSSSGFSGGGSSGGGGGGGGGGSW